MQKFSIKDGFYNLVNTKFFSRAMYVFFVIAAGTLLYFYKTIFSDPSVSFYTFSTIVQGFLALIGFLGTVVIFKLQVIENTTSQLLNFEGNLVRIMRDYRGMTANTYGPDEFITQTREIVRTNPDGYGVEALRIGADTLEQKQKEKSDLRSLVVDFSLLSFVNIFIALIGIPFSRFYVAYEAYLPLAIYVLVNLILSFVSVIFAFRLIKSSLGYTFKITVMDTVRTS